MQLLEQVVPYFSLGSLGILGATALLCFIYPKLLPKPVGVIYLTLAGSILAWALSLFSFITPTFYLPLLIFAGDEFFSFIPTFAVHEYSLPIAQLLLTMNLVRFLTRILQQDQTSSEQWAGELFLVLLSILSCFSANPLTLLIIWIAMDGMQIWTSLQIFYPHSQPLVISYPFIFRWFASFIFLWLLALEQGSLVDITLLELSPLVRTGLILLILVRSVLLLMHYPAENTHPNPPPYPHLSYHNFLSASSSFAVLTNLSASGSFEISWANPTILAILTIGFVIGWFLASHPFPWMPLAFFALSLALTLQNNIFGALGWGMTFLTLAFFTEHISLYHHLEKWNLFPAMLAILVIPFTPLWYGIPSIFSSQSVLHVINISETITATLLFFGQATCLFAAARQMYLFSSPLPLGKRFKETLPSLISNALIWVVYFCIGVWSSFYAPKPPLLAMIPYPAAFILFLFILYILHRQESIIQNLLTRYAWIKHQLGQQALQQLKTSPISYQLGSGFRRISLTSTAFVTTVSELIEEEGGLLWGFILFVFLISLLFQSA